MNINQNSIKIVFSGIILVLAIMRFLFFETVNERMDSVFFLLLLLAFLIPVLPWERLKSFKAGGVEFSLDQPNVVGAIESLGLDRIENKQLRKLLSKQSSQIKQLKGARILWIDDKPHNVVGAQRLLRALGADVTTATTSEMAEDILNKDNDFDLIITDVQRHGESYKFNDGRPKHEGVNFVVKLRSNRDPVIRSMPVVFYAAYDWKRLVTFTRPAQETFPEPKISNSIMDMVQKVLSIISDVRSNPIQVNATKKPTGLGPRFENAAG